MDPLLVVLPAVVQGVTEFLPVSSSGHLALLQATAGIEEPPLAFNVSLHVGTLAAVLALYGKDACRTAAGGARWLARVVRRRGRGGFGAADDWEREAGAVAVATVVTGALALLFRDPLEAAAGSPRTIGILFLAGAAPLAFTRLAPAAAGGVTPWRAVLIGVVQAVAVLPGVSRSGMTIAAALFLGVGREAAARFSFLISIPAIVGAEAIALSGGLSGAAAPAWQHVAGALIAAAVGFASLRLLVRVVRRGALHWFAAYLAPLGIAVAIIFAR